MVCLEDEDGAMWVPKRLDLVEWKLLIGAVEVLEFVLEVTKVWEMEIRPTMNLVVAKLFDLTSHIEAFIEKRQNCR